MLIPLKYVEEVIEIGEANNKLLTVWKDSTGKERLDFIIVLCSRYRVLIKEVVKRVEERLKNKEEI